MGTSGAYSGGGGKAGKVLREGLAGWLDGLAEAPPTAVPTPNGETQPPGLPLPVVAQALGLFRPSSAGGSGGEGGATGVGRRGAGQEGRQRTGGIQRSVRRSAATAGRAAAAAYAFSTGNRAELARLRLDYDALRRIDDPLELTRRIVDAACGPLGEGAIEDHEQRYVAAEIAEWIFARHEAGSNPDPEEIVRKTIATIIAEAIESETGAMLRQGERPLWATELAEREIRDVAEVLAERAELSVDGITEQEFARAIEDGIETLRRILGGGD